MKISTITLLHIKFKLPGDMFEVELKIIMEKDETTGFYINKEYEVLKVLNHIPISKHDSLEL